MCGSALENNTVKQVMKYTKYNLGKDQIKRGDTDVIL